MSPSNSWPSSPAKAGECVRSSEVSISACVCVAGKLVFLAVPSKMAARLQRLLVTRELYYFFTARAALQQALLLYTQYEADIQDAPSFTLA